MILEKTEKAYKDILALLSKHKDLHKFDIEDLKRKSETHLFGLKLKESYGLDINEKSVDSTTWNKFGDYRNIGRWGEKHNCKISWSVDGRQPEDEMLLQICIPTGAYIFGGDYPKEIFIDFWKELKSYKPKYADEVNHCIYFDLENAADIFNNFESILSKHRDINREDAKNRRIKQLEAELEKLNK